MLIRFTTDRFGRLSFDDERPAREGASVAFDEWRDAADAAFDAVAGASRGRRGRVQAHVQPGAGAPAQGVRQVGAAAAHLRRPPRARGDRAAARIDPAVEPPAGDARDRPREGQGARGHLAAPPRQRRRRRQAGAPARARARATRRRAPSPPRALSPGAAARAGRHRVARPPHAQGRGARPPRAFFRARARRRAEAEALSISLPLSARCAITT